MTLNTFLTMIMLSYLWLREDSVGDWDRRGQLNSTNRLYIRPVDLQIWKTEGVVTALSDYEGTWGMVWEEKLPF